MLNRLQELDFRKRLKFADCLTWLIMGKLTRMGHFVAFKKATKEEDEHEAIDYWVDRNRTVFEPIQFKLRIVPGNSDFPCVLYQPFYGVDREDTVIGRDYKGVVQGKTKYYYVASRQEHGSFEVFWINKEILKSHILAAEQEWEAGDRSRPWLVSKARCTAQKNALWYMRECNERGKGMRMIYSPENGTVPWEIWWQKNPNESFAKINLYLSCSLKEGSITIPAEVCKRMEEDIYRYLVS
jgi:hypothetical protein